MKQTCLFLITCCFLINACTTVDVFEKNITIPKHEWSSSFRPEIRFEINDTLSEYNIFAVVRHTDAYRYKNIWVNIYTQAPGDSSKKQQLDLRLATDNKGWLGSGMDDIFEHRILITGKPILLKSGTYLFKLENIMREDPLEHVMNVGIRVEKAKS
ncbi:MAG: gliding motility lipoprotein GldH [Chitinophagaceae bacterium]|nr:gliding motility lipoprotein GldH [Chitinophagaceae bacterium]